MTSAANPPVALVPNQGWDPRLLICRHDLAYAGFTLPMHVFIIVTERYVVLVDTLINASTAEALLDIARPHLAGRQLLVANTHADSDHAWGNQYFDGPHSPAPAPIIGTLRCAARLRSAAEQTALAELQAEQPAEYAGVRLVPPSILFDDALIIDGGDLTLEFFATPGHTPDHCSICIPEIGLLLAGDAAEQPLPFVGDDGLSDLRASLERLATLEPRAAFYCHAPLDAGPDLIRANLAYFDRIEARCRAALARGAPAQPVADADLEALVDLPFAAAIPPGAHVERGFYRPGHHAAIRAMLAHLGGAA